MDQIEKLLRKIARKERAELLSLISRLSGGEKILGIKKLTGSDFYRLRKGNYRIIFHYDKNGEVIIDSIKLRNEATYSDF